MSRVVLWLSYLLAACAVASITHLWRSWMPPVSPPSTSASVFSGQASYDILRNITTSKHPLKSQADLDVYHYLYDQLEAINRTASLVAPGDSSWPTGLVFETPRNAMRTVQTNATPTDRPTPRPRHCKDYEDIVNNTQIIVRVPGALPSSILLTAHFDSAPASFGASDDGAGVAVILETLRAILASPTQPDHSLVVFLDNGEEVGLCGSKWFVQSDLAEAFKVKVFVNLEGGGAGGRAILFRATDNQLASLYGQVAPYPHMNSMGGTLIGLLGSSTDYEIYQPAAIPGMDIAFYEHREFYHTPGDSVDHISAQDVQHCGANVLAITRALLNTNSLDEWVSDDHALYFDLMGRWGFTLTVATRWIVVGIVWLTSLAVVAVHFHWFPVQSKTTMGAFVRSLVGVWWPLATALSLGSVFSVMANLPLVGFLLATYNPLLSWTVLPNAVLGHVGGALAAAILWRRRLGVVQATPPSLDWMHLATAASTFAAFLCAVFPFNSPLLYLFPIASLAYSGVLLVAMVASLAVTACRRPRSDGLSWKAGASYTSIPAVRATDGATRASMDSSVVASLVATFVGYLFLSLPVALDNVWMMQSVGGYDPIIMAAVPLILGPTLYMALPWLVASDASDGFALFQVYLVVWAVATVQCAASHLG